MWVFTSNSFLSIVKHREITDQLLVRSRFPGHIEQAFPHAKVEETLQADYRFRAAVSRSVVAAYMADQVFRIEYPNFKSSISEKLYHDVAISVWTELFIWGKKLLGVMTTQRARRTA